MSSRPPTLSVVATSRNDDHGGNLLKRTQLFVDGLAEQASHYEVPLELLLVEWNPPDDRPGLAEALRWAPSDYFQPQVVTVPPEIHRTFAGTGSLPLFQMIAKNVGIRRARADFVLATNIDILVSDELVAFIKSGLKPNALFRVDRYDVRADLDGARLPTPAECRALPVIREHTLEGMRYPARSAKRGPRTIRRPESVSRLVMAAWDRVVLPRLHTLACGDFTLTSKEIWNSLRGYPEWPVYSWQLDGVPMYQAYAAGVEMVNLPRPMAVYHLEHGEGSGWTPEASRKLFARLDAAGIPYMTTDAYRKIARKLVRGRGFQPFHGSEWGLASMKLGTIEPKYNSVE